MSIFRCLKINSRPGSIGRKKTKYHCIKALLGLLADAVIECAWMTEYHSASVRPPGLTGRTSLRDTSNYDAKGIVKNKNMKPLLKEDKRVMR